MNDILVLRRMREMKMDVHQIVHTRVRIAIMNSLRNSTRIWVRIVLLVSAVALQIKNVVISPNKFREEFQGMILIDIFYIAFRTIFGLKVSELIIKQRLLFKSL